MLNVDNDIPQWKKDLIARLRNQNKRTATAVERQQEQQLFTRPLQSTSALVGRSSVQQPILTCGGSTETVAPVAASNSHGSVSEKCDQVSAKVSTTNPQKMVQERAWLREPACKNGEYEKSSDSDSSEDLRYGPGIVNKLRNKYLSLALRESNSRTRASILPLRKAASLENILDDDTPDCTATSGGNRLFQPRLNGSNDIAKNVPNRYRNAVRGPEMKRARSVEAILRSTDHDETRQIEDVRPKRESLHEEMLIKEKEGSDKYSRVILDNNKMLETALDNKVYSQRINRPKRITPIMNEREKPPVDVVKHTKMIFERRPDQRTRAPPQTGEVAAKVATYKNIIVQSKIGKKPPIKVKPVVSSGKSKAEIIRNEKTSEKTKKIQNQKPAEPVPVQELPALEITKVKTPSLPSPIPDISRVDFPKGNEHNSNNTSLTETPDLIVTSSPVHPVNSSAFRISATENFIKEEILHSNNISATSVLGSSKSVEKSEHPGVKKVDPQNPKSINNAANTTTFKFAKSAGDENCLPTNKNVLNVRTPPSEPLKLEINGFSSNSETKKPSQDNEIVSPPVKSPRSSPGNNKKLAASSPNKVNLTTLEREKNLINKAKTLEKPKTSAGVANGPVENVLKINVPKVKKPPREPENNSIVFKFTDRKEVPDYVHNDGTNRVTKVEKPKVGEGGIILLPGASIDESFTDEDEEIMRSLEAPPSPCDVTFINDNILIDGKSSLSHKAKKAKMKISFVEAGPDVYEYPSESSFLIEDLPTSPTNAQMGHTVPSLCGSSSLATYTPKTTEDFQPGVTRSIQSIPSKPDIPKAVESTDETVLEEPQTPILFSAGTNSDILF